MLGGEVDSFEELILRYQPRIFGMARKYFRNESDVEDAVQTIFTKTYQKLGSFNHTAPFEHWFMRLSVKPVTTRSAASPSVTNRRSPT